MAGELYPKTAGSPAKVLVENMHIKSRGFSLIELMVAIAVLAIILTFALPNFQTWIRNIQVTNAAQSITAGLQKARGEAVARNANVSFTLGADSGWTISIVNPAQVLETRAASEGSNNVTHIVGPGGAETMITFNNMGVIVANADGSATLMQVDLSATGATRNLRIVIRAGGSARMCNPSLASGSNVSAC